MCAMQVEVLRSQMQEARLAGIKTAEGAGMSTNELRVNLEAALAGLPPFPGAWLCGAAVWLP